MPQEQNVLKCFSCETFQVHIVKKAKKWECKICGAKQSFIHSYGRGSGKDCRLHVMKLNELRVKKGSNVEELNFNQSFDERDVHTVNDVNEKTNSTKETSTANKWLQYVDDDELDEGDFSCEETELKINDKKRKRTDDKQLIFESHFKKFCNEKEISDNYKLPHDISINRESYLNINRGAVSSTKDSEEQQETKSSQLKEEVKLDNKQDCNKKSSNIFNSNPNDLEELINISF